MEHLFPNEPMLQKYVRAWEIAEQHAENSLTAFEAKVIYTFGMMRHLIESAGWCLLHQKSKSPLYISAFALTTAAIELLGRCISGDDRERNGCRDRLESGLRYIATHCQERAGKSSTIFLTQSTSYSIDSLINLRNFCAHGGSIGKMKIDADIVGILITTFVDAMQKYWDALQRLSNEDIRENMAKAAIIPIVSHEKPLLMDEICNHLKHGAHISENIRYREAWEGYSSVREQVQIQTAD